jgi:hypothetical protein
LVPYTIKATAASTLTSGDDVSASEAGDLQQQQETEAATMQLIANLLEQLLTLQELDEVLILVRSHRVLHQVWSPRIQTLALLCADARTADGCRHRARVSVAFLTFGHESTVCRA